MKNKIYVFFIAILIIALLGGGITYIKRDATQISTNINTNNINENYNAKETEKNSTPVDIFNKLSKDEITKIEDFIEPCTNSEVFFDKVDNISSDDLCKIIYNLYNINKTFKNKVKPDKTGDDFNSLLKKEKITKLIYDYFGINKTIINPPSGLGFEYENGYYKFSYATGDPQNKPKVYKVEQNNNILNVYADVILTGEQISEFQYKIKSTILKDSSSIFEYKVICISKIENEIANTPLLQKTKKNTNNVLYKNEKLGFSFEIPESWIGKYSIEENANGVSVYFEPIEPLEEKIGWLFSIESKVALDDEDTFDTIGDLRNFVAKGITYIVGGPTDVNFPDDHKEFEDFIKLTKDISGIVSTIKVIN